MDISHTIFKTRKYFITVYCYYYFHDGGAVDVCTHGSWLWSMVAKCGGEEQYGRYMCHRYILSSNSSIMSSFLQKTRSHV